MTGMDHQLYNYYYYPHHNTGILTVPSNCTSGEVRLSGKVTPESGRLELCINNAWGTVCNNNWDVNDARLACRDLGFQFYSKSFLLVVF